MEVMEDLFWNKVKFLIKKKNYAYVYSFSFSKFSFLLPLSLKNLPLSKERNAWKVVAGDGCPGIATLKLKCRHILFPSSFWYQKDSSVFLNTQTKSTQPLSMPACLGFREQSAEAYAQ